MKRIASISIVTAGLAVCACLAVSAYWITPVRAQQGQAQQGTALQGAAQAGSPQQDAASLTPPPAYTPPPKGTPPMEDTPAQKEALARWKARAEQRVEEDRKAYNAEVTPTYNFHYGPKNPFTPGNV
jgi:opacity protein-like surface antigen